MSKEKSDVSKYIEKTIKELKKNNQRTDERTIIIWAYRDKRFDVLNWLYETLVPEHLGVLTTCAIQRNDLNNVILCHNLCQEYNIPFEYQERDVGMCNDVKVLQWLYDNTDFHYDKRAIVKRAGSSTMWREIEISTEVAVWWLKSNLPLDLGDDENIINIIHHTGIKFLNQLHEQGVIITFPVIKGLLGYKHAPQKDICQFFLDHYRDTLEAILESPDIVDHISSSYCFSASTLQWILDNRLPFNYTEKAIDGIISIQTAEFWSRSGLELLHTEEGFYKCFIKKDVAEWWVKNKLSVPTPFVLNKVNSYWLKTLIDLKIDLEYTEEAMDTVSKLTTYDDQEYFIDLWLSSGLELKFTHITVNCLISHLAVRQLDVLYQRGYSLPFTLEAIDDLIGSDSFSATSKEFTDFVKWWFDHDMDVDLIHVLATKLRDNEHYHNIYLQLEELFQGYGIVLGDVPEVKILFVEDVD